MTSQPFIYLDHAATTPLCKEAFEAMLPFLQKDYGNPNSMHSAGLAARMSVEEARKRLARLIKAEPSEIIFTSGATESNNLAIRGVLEPLIGKKTVHIVVSGIEHPSVAETCIDLQKRGVEVTVVAPGANGVVSVENMLAAVRPETALVSMMFVNNEIGTIQPIQELGAALKKMKVRPLFHVDAVQAVVSLSVDVGAMGADLVSLSAHKIGGPKGVGALFVRRGVKLSPILTGGGQESGLRSGTENVPGIVGFGAAALRLSQQQEEMQKKFVALKDFFCTYLRSSGATAQVLFLEPSVAPQIVALECPGAEADFLVLVLGKAGFAVSAGSACHAGSRETSHILKAVGLNDQRARSVIRVSFGFETTEEEIKKFIDALNLAMQRRGFKIT